MVIYLSIHPSPSLPLSLYIRTKFLVSFWRQSDRFLSLPRLITDSFSPAAVLPIRRVSLQSDGAGGEKGRLEREQGGAGRGARGGWTEEGDDRGCEGRVDREREGREGREREDGDGSGRGGIGRQRGR